MEHHKAEKYLRFDSQVDKPGDKSNASVDVTIATSPFRSLTAACD